MSAAEWGRWGVVVLALLVVAYRHRLGLLVTAGLAVAAGYRAGGLTVAVLAGAVIVLAVLCAPLIDLAVMDRLGQAGKIGSRLRWLLHYARFVSCARVLPLAVRLMNCDGIPGVGLLALGERLLPEHMATVPEYAGDRIDGAYPLRILRARWGAVWLWTALDPAPASRLAPS